MVVSMLLAAPAMAAGTGAQPAEKPAVEAPRKTVATHRAATRARPNGYNAAESRACDPNKAYDPETCPDHTIAAYVGTAAVPSVGLGATYSGIDNSANWRQTGVASWYGGSRWQGHRTSSGERYEQNALTAAHATLPIGTKVRVTLAGSDRSVVVTINDRPGTRKRIIDLSRGAAAQLGILNRGVAVVTLAAL
jgi:rare lipoprotein A (peptidoglycan hydrolase)